MVLINTSVSCICIIGKNINSIKMLFVRKNYKVPKDINGTPLQYSCLENPMDGGAWWAAVHGVTRSWTRLSDFTFTFHFHALEKEMATHSSVLAWRIPGTVEPGGLLCLGSHRVGHDWSDLAAARILKQRYLQHVSCAMQYSKHSFILTHIILTKPLWGRYYKFVSFCSCGN